MAEVTEREEEAQVEPTEPGEVREDGGAVSEALDTAWIQQVRSERDERVKEETLRLGVPTWGPEDYPDLILTFKVLPRPRIEEFNRKSARANRKKQGGSELDMSFIAEACESVWMRHPETGKLLKLKDEKDQPVRLDTRLAKILGLPSDGAGANHQTLLAYLVKDNGVALGGLAIKVARWMVNTSSEIEGAVLGE